MKQVIVTLYQYDELSESSQQTALKYFSDINVHYPWYDFTYEDAINIGLKITSHDLYHHDIEGKLTLDIEDSIEKILSTHGKICDTYKLALDYKDHLTEIQNRMSYASESKLIALEKAVEELTTEYEHNLLEEYLLMLRREYAYLTSQEAIEETIRANEYDFTKEGKLF